MTLLLPIEPSAYYSGQDVDYGLLRGYVAYFYQEGYRGIEHILCCIARIDAPLQQLEARQSYGLDGSSN
jgi:hypothetical protein